MYKIMVLTIFGWIEFFKTDSKIKALKRALAYSKKGFKVCIDGLDFE